MERAAAKPFRMLSAYFMTAATTSPPRAWRGGMQEGRKERHNESWLCIDTCWLHNNVDSRAARHDLVVKLDTAGCICKDAPLNSWPL